jgi:hypothetical protein
MGHPPARQVRGTSPYYLIELLTQRGSSWLILLWVASFVAFSALLSFSDHLQYDCFSFCDTRATQSCSLLLQTANATDISWRAAPSECLASVQLPAVEENTTNIDAVVPPFLWSSQGSFSLPPAAPAALDVIPEMTSTARRIGRFILRFDLSEYSVDPLITSTRPMLHCVRRVEDRAVADGGPTTVLSVLPTPVLLSTIMFDNILMDVLVPGGSAAVVFELPIGYRFPAGTQQLVLEFPGGPPLVPRPNATAARPLQLTLASSSPTYLMYEVLLRYVLLGATCGLVVVVLCLHALADTAVYDVFHPSVPSFDGWLACFAAVSFVTETESLRAAWGRQPVFIKCSLISLCIVAVNCDPLSALYLAIPENVFLQFWTRSVVPWLQLTWMVLTSAWLLGCLATCGDHGALYARAASLRRYVRKQLGTTRRELPSLSMTAIVPLSTPNSSALDSPAPLPSGLVEELEAAAATPFSPTNRLWATCTPAKVLVATLALMAPALYVLTLVVLAAKGEYDLQPQIVTSGVRDEDSHIVWWIGAVTALPMLVTGWYYHQRTLFARFPRGVADNSGPSSFGVPSQRYNARPYIVAVRYLVPYSIAAMMYVSVVYVATYTHLSYLLPSYNNGHLVEVLITVLLGWTVAVMLVPVRKSFATHPPKPCIYPSRSSSSFDPTVPLWCQLPWRAAYDVGLASGEVPNCGYAFLTEEQEVLFYRAQHEYGVEQLIGQYRSGGAGDQRVNASAIVPPGRSFFCWETAVRCVNLSNETYNDLEGDLDLCEYTRTVSYEPDEFESCVVQNCCVTRLLMGGACGGERDEDDVLPIEAANVVSIGATSTPTVPLAFALRHHFDGERTPFVMAPSSRRFTEAGAVAIDATRHSARRQRRRTHVYWDNINTEDRHGSDDVRRHMASPGKGVQSSNQVGIVEDSFPTVTTTNAVRTAVVPNLTLATKRPPPIVVEAATEKPLSPEVGVRTHDGAQNRSGTSGDEALRATYASSVNVPLSLVNLVAPKGQINVSRYGYQLIKVLEVFGVRMLIVATPPHTSGRHRHLSIAFRGTVNIRNALTNVNARMSKHPEMTSEGGGGNGGEAEVHSGFWAAFQQLLPTLSLTLHEFFFPAAINVGRETRGEPLATAEWARELTHVIVTGHSLGGVLAMLCAYSMARGALHRDVFSLLARKLDIRCYTFGSPRLGNAYLSTVYNNAVPETYRVINENDVVSHVGLFWHEHTGREVRINRDGDAVVEGTYLERCYTSLIEGVGSRLKNHLLDRYGNSFDNCLCSRNLKFLSPACCSFMMVHVDDEAEDGDVRNQGSDDDTP